MRTIGTVIALIAALALAGCGGGGGPSALTPDELRRFESDPRVVRAGEIAKRADTLLVPGVYLDLSVTARGETERERVAVAGTCSGTRCDLSGEGGSGTITLEELLVPSDAELTRAELGERAGLDTVIVEGRTRLSESVSDASITASASATSYGVWGQHGFAGLEIASGPFSGSLEGVPFSGSIKGAVSYAFGTVNPTNPTNPTGSGSATWRGVAEAASTRTFERRLGTSTLTIPDLSQPRIGVEIDVAGYDVSAPGWDDMLLANGRFSAGTPNRNYMAGNFYSPKHEEAYGVFDTGAYVGAFGAKRQ